MRSDHSRARETSVGEPLWNGQRENSLSLGRTDQNRFKRKFEPGSCREHVAAAKAEGLMARSDQSRWFPDSLLLWKTLSRRTGSANLAPILS